MDHADVRDWLESAALERGGLDPVRPGRVATRTARGADPDPVVVAALVAHLDTCAACRAERDAWIRTADAVGRSAPTGADLQLEGPAPELRDRTLALVRATGVPRGAAAPRGTDAATPVSASPASFRDDEAVSREEIADHAAIPVQLAARRPRGRVLAWALAAAAVVVLVAGSGLASLTALSDRDQANADAAELARLTASVDSILRDPSRHVVPLRHPDGSDAGASVSWSQASDKLVVIATSLSEPPSGSVYRCWVESGGSHRAVGTMWLVNGVGYWEGPIEGWGGITAGSKFGVSLVPAGSTGGQVVLEGSI